MNVTMMRMRIMRMTMMRMMRKKKKKKQEEEKEEEKEKEKEKEKEQKMMISFFLGQSPTAVSTLLIGCRVETGGPKCLATKHFPIKNGCFP